MGCITCLCVLHVHLARAHSCVLTRGKITGGSGMFEHLEVTEVITSP